MWECSVYGGRGLYAQGHAAPAGGSGGDSGGGSGGAAALGSH